MGKAGRAAPSVTFFGISEWEMEAVQEPRSLQYQLEAIVIRGEMPHFSPLPDSRFFPGKWTLKGGAAEQIDLLFPKCFL